MLKNFLLAIVCLFSFAAFAEEPEAPVVRDMSSSINSVTNAMNNSASLSAEQQAELQKQLDLIKANSEESEKLMKEMDAN